MSRKMKDSNLEWQGQVPTIWKKIYLKWYYDFEKGKNAALYTTDYIGLHKGIFPVYSGQTENNGVMGNIDTYDYEMEECLFTTTVGAKVMTPCLLSGKFSLSQNCLIMKKKHQISNNFMFYLLICLFDYEKSLIPSYMQPSLRIEDLKKYQFFLPPIQEQKAIAEFLDRKCGEIDELVALQERMIEELKAYKQSVISEAVTKGLNPNAPQKDSGIEWIGQIPEHWEIKPFKAIYSLGKGLTITKADLVEKGIAVLSYGQIHSKSNNGTSIKDELIRYVPSNFLENNQNCLVNQGDLIFADTSEDLEGCGNCIFVDKDMLLFAGYHTIIAFNKSLYKNKYFSYLFKTDSWRTQIRTLVNGVKLYSIPQKTLYSTYIIVPTLSEQQEIAGFLEKKCSEIDSLIALKQTKIEELKDYKKSIIYEYVTGKKEVEIQ